MRVVWYTVLRLLTFAVPFGLMMLLPYFRAFPWLAAVFSALIGLSLSVIFLSRRREDLARALAARSRPADSDAAAEDAAADDLNPDLHPGDAHPGDPRPDGR